MAIKIPNYTTSAEDDDGSYFLGRIIREPTWRKIMAVLRAAEAWGKDDVGESVNALKRHLSKE
jgi:hypothetical protein